MCEPFFCRNQCDLASVCAFWKQLEALDSASCTCLSEGTCLLHLSVRGRGVEHQQAAAHSQRDTIATMSRSTSTLAQRQELRRLLAQYPTLLSHEGPGDEYLVTRKIEMMIENASSKQSTTSKQKLQSEW